MSRHDGSGPEIGLPGRLLAGLLSGKHRRVRKQITQAIDFSSSPTSLECWCRSSLERVYVYQALMEKLDMANKKCIRRMILYACKAIFPGSLCSVLQGMP